jgi:dTDP-4-dehydrorhamnose 3,5-epimerase
MNIQETPLRGLFVIEPRVFRDPRGYFFESFNSKSFIDAGINDNFVQDNQSLSQKGVLRGLHFQIHEAAQSKLVRVITGAVWDVAVDIRKGSPTYGQYFGIEINEENNLMVYIPQGFAHGFLTLRDHTIFSYKCGNFYNKPLERGILWNDPDINIQWSLGADEPPLLSDKDRENPLLRDFDSPFTYPF